MGISERAEVALRWTSADNLRPKQLPLKERIRLAKEHAADYGQLRDALWPHQQFALSLGELLDAAERGA